MYCKHVLAIWGLLMALSASLAFAETCPILPAESEYMDIFVRYDIGQDTFHKIILTGTALLLHQYEPDNCLFDGKITIENATDADGETTTSDPVFSTLIGTELGFVGAMSVEGKKVMVNRSIGSWHERGTMTNYDRHSKSFMDSEYIIEGDDIAGKGVTTGIMSP